MCLGLCIVLFVVALGYVGGFGFVLLGFALLGLTLIV